MMKTLKKIWTMIWPFSGPSEEELAATQLYAAAVADARAPKLYTEMGVPDSLDGRFDSIALHLFILLRRMKDEASLDRVAHELIGVFMTDLDRSLREIGIGDMSIGKHVNKMAKAFYGRLHAYDGDLTGDSFKSFDDPGFADALRRNLYRGAEIADEKVAAVVNHVKRYDQHVKAIDAAFLGKGVLPIMKDQNNG